ncbi:MAG: carboxypeptidase-like regulatory domain-containing protein [Ekhidna sp.]|nr:carboxypeptidase-like regulatory domain-containing protein [Ekhidna sp.]
MRIAIVCSLIYFSAHLLCGQTFTGRVVDSRSNEGLIGAHVYFLKNWRVGTIAGLDGVFELQVSEADRTDSLIVSFVGFKEQIVPLSNPMIIRLEEIESQGETVVVTAKSLIAEEFKYVEIKKLDIYTNPAAKADPILAVNSLPSATTTDESANISLRGSSPLETGVFFNNVPIYDGVRYSQLNGIGTFSIFNTDIIKSVNVFPGNPPIEFGNATSGVISMQTDDRIVKESSNSLILSLASIGLSRQQRINEKSSIKVFSNWQPSGPIKEVNSEALEEIDSFTSNDLGLYWYGNAGISWKILAYGVTEGYRFNFTHPSYRGYFDQKKQRGFLIGSLEKSIGAGTITLNNGFSTSNGDYSYSNVAFNTLKKDVFIGLNYLLAKEKYSIKTGFSYDQRRASVLGTFHQFGYALDSDHPTVAIDEELVVEVPEFFGYLKYYLSDKFALGTGLRKNISNTDISGYLSSQANLAYTGGDWTVTMGAGRYHKNGLRENTGLPFSAENDQFSLDIKRSVKNLDLTVSFFDKNGQIDDNRYTSRGIEWFTAYRLNTNLRTSASLTLLDAASEEGTYIYDLSYFLRGNISWNPTKFWTLEAIWVARQGTLASEVADAIIDEDLAVYQPMYSEEQVRLPYYLNVGFSISKAIEVSEEISMIAFGSVNNAFDRANLLGYNYNVDYSERSPRLFALRTVYFGAVVNF